MSARKFILELNKRFDAEDWAYVRSEWPTMNNALQKMQAMADVEAQADELVRVRRAMQTEKDPAKMAQLVKRARELTRDPEKANLFERKDEDDRRRFMK